jgi:hypothetical protein
VKLDQLTCKCISDLKPFLLRKVGCLSVVVLKSTEVVDNPWNLLLKFSDSDELVPFVADRKSTILKLKQSVERLRDIPLSHQKVIFKASCLPDDLILSDIPNLLELSLLVIWNTAPIREPKKLPISKIDPFEEAAMWRDEMLPLNKLKKPTSDRIPVILYFPGTFCPIHAGHIHTLKVAKTYAESLGVWEISKDFTDQFLDL